MAAKNILKTMTPHLIEVADDFWRRAYAPYSKFQVGASAWTDLGVYGGCNVENASYGGTICAERVAILKAVSQGAKDVKAVVVVTHTKVATPPCALCLQTMAEFCSRDAVIILSDGKRIRRTFKFKDLLPQTFARRKDLGFK